MEVNRRTQADRSAATREALVVAARALFAARGYAAVGTEAIVRTAGVTRGAMYHQFTDKAELFAAVFEAVEADVTTRLVEVAVAAGDVGPLEAMRVGAGAWLDACAEPEVQQIALVDAPSVLGWDRWRQISQDYGMGLVEALLHAAIDAGAIAEQPVRPLAHVLIGALDEAALYVSRATDAEKATARADMDAVLDQLLQALEVRPQPKRRR